MNEVASVAQPIHTVFVDAVDTLSWRTGFANERHLMRLKRNTTNHKRGGAHALAAKGFANRVN